jgi:integrase
MVDKPRIERDEPEWLEPGEAAKFLAECKGDLHTLMAIALLTGARKQEVTGLEWSDVDFKRGLIQIRPNQWRKLKRAHSKRSVKLWPQLYAILEPLKQKNGLVVPNRLGEPYSDVRGGMEGAAERAKISKEVSWNTLRHTYASLRLQTLDNGAAISPFKVAHELGHKGLTMIFEHYGHVIESPQRLEVIEYKLEEEK